MRRTDRLFDLVTALRDGRLHRAQDLAERLEVSVRTIYRDMETLQASGIPVEGERGVGYMLTAPVTLPPLNLTLLELEALELGMAVVAEAADPELQSAARSLSAKIDAVIPADRAPPKEGWGFAVYPFADAARGFRHMPSLRGAIRARQKLDLAYRDAEGKPSSRTIRPLQMEYWGRVWTLTAWDETRGDFRSFRVDRIEELRALPELFVDEPGKSLADYLDRITKAP
ncbi:MAG: YafY family transcriptional regulator [Rhodobacteraceae bacterium]|jgi:predicted DNA-binding transcriptional regulator YafY|nr:YafY family transcriptional regulator [Paracoccaceae bacterium]